MSENITTFEVEVLVKSGQMQYKPITWYGKAEWTCDKSTRMYHIDARTHEQAIEKSRKYGEFVSCHKADATKMLGNPEKLLLDEPPPSVYDFGNPYSSALAMDEMVWKKRNNRRKNMGKDKKLS